MALRELILSVMEAAVTFGGKPLFENLSFNIHEGDKICLVGRNGAGKTTLMQLITGTRELDGGKRWQVPGIRIAGKTGTAQIQRPDGMQNIAWFMAFAPAEQPEIALAVVLEGDQPNVEFAGAAHAAPVAGEIMAAYFEKRAK